MSPSLAQKCTFSFDNEDSVERRAHTHWRAETLRKMLQQTVKTCCVCDADAKCFLAVLSMASTGAAVAVTFSHMLARNRGAKVSVHEKKKQNIATTRQHVFQLQPSNMHDFAARAGRRALP